MVTAWLKSGVLKDLANIQCIQIFSDDLIGEVNHPKSAIEINKQLQILICDYSIGKILFLYDRISDKRRVTQMKEITKCIVFRNNG